MQNLQSNSGEPLSQRLCVLGRSVRQMPGGSGGDQRLCFALNVASNSFSGGRASNLHVLLKLTSTLYCRPFINAFISIFGLCLRLLRTSWVMLGQIVKKSWVQAEALGFFHSRKCFCCHFFVVLWQVTVTTCSLPGPETWT